MLSACEHLLQGNTIADSAKDCCAPYLRAAQQLNLAVWQLPYADALAAAVLLSCCCCTCRS